VDVQAGAALDADARGYVVACDRGVTLIPGLALLLCGVSSFFYGPFDFLGDSPILRWRVMTAVGDSP